MLVLAGCTIVTLAAETHDWWLLIPWAGIAVITVINMILTWLWEA